MAQAKNNTHKRRKVGRLTTGLLLTFVLCPLAFAAPVTYTYDDLNRLTQANYNNGQRIISYSYDAAGNMFTKATTVAEQSLPVLTIASPANGSAHIAAGITLSGTASDADQGDSGIASVTINSLSAVGGTATGAGIANWTFGALLAPGTNDFTVVATDSSPFANQSTQMLSVVYLPRIIDGNNNDIPDAWESLNNVTDPSTDSDLDGISDGDEYRAGTDPQVGTSRPEGANGVNYVYLRDHFTDAQYDDRWYLGSLDVNALYGLTEAGTELQATLQMPTVGCKAMTLRGFAPLDVTAAVFHARLRLTGYGQTSTGLMLGDDPNNRLEIILDADQTPYVTLRSVAAGIVTDTVGTIASSLQGATVDVRITKNGADYTVYVGSTAQGTLTNAAIGDTGLKPFLGLESCTGDTGYADSRFDVIELLLDRDADGRPDTWEDANADGVVAATETDPINLDSDADGVLDGYDNCAVTSNSNQRDTNSDGYGNICDADINNDGAVNFADLGLLKAKFFTADADADLNGDGAVNFADLGLLKSMFFKAPGPSGVIVP